MRAQFLLEVTNTTREDPAASGVGPRTALMDLRRLVNAWAGTEHHRRHSKTGQTPLLGREARRRGSRRVPRALPAESVLATVVRRSELRVANKTAAVSLTATTRRIDSALPGRSVELQIFRFDL